jgi:hypothetical protein
MDIGSLLIILAAAVVVTLLVTRPFYDPRQRHMQQARLTTNGGAVNDLARSEEQVRSTLLAERDRVLIALKELDFDHALGKIAEEDYPIQRSALLKTGADILRQLDSAGGEAADTHDLAAATANQDESETGAQDDIEALIAARRRQKQESVRVKDSQKTTVFCHECGKPLQKTDKFCSRCGATIG